jgi:hypothetical protein
MAFARGQISACNIQHRPTEPVWIQASAAGIELRLDRQRLPGPWNDSVSAISCGILELRPSVRLISNTPGRTVIRFWRVWQWVRHHEPYPRTVTA